MSTRALRATVRGQVQGVAFRAATLRRARELGVFGWVKNLPGGEVQVHAEGDARAVDALAAFLHEGPPAAQVDAVDLADVKVEGHEQFAIRGVPAGRFLVAEGERGFTLWLELADGDWRTWVLAKAPSMVPAEKRLARPLSADDAPPAELPTSAGKGAWDAGTYEQGGRVAWPEAIDRGHAVFVLHGERLQGGFALQRTGPGRWLLIKRRDEFATP